MYLLLFGLIFSIFPVFSVLRLLQQYFFFIFLIFFFHTTLFLRYNLFQINQFLCEKAKYINENAIN